MNDESPIILLDETTTNKSRQNTSVNIIELELNILGESVCFYIAVMDRQARLADIVPLARLLSTKVNHSVRAMLSSDGITVPCGKGCATCCYFLVVLSVPEAIQLVEEVTVEMPEELGAHVVHTSHKVGKRIRQQFPKYLASNKGNNVSCSELKRISDWYSTLEQPCPFLWNNTCAIYERRPIVCRDWLAIGSASQCRLGKNNKTARIIQTLPDLGYVLGQLASELEHTNRQGIFLHDVFIWYLQNKHRCTRTWSATVMVKRFVEIAKAMAEKDSANV